MDAKYIGKLCTKIGTEWHLLGICLGFTSVQMEHLRHAHPTNIYQCAFELISKWNSVLEQHNIETRPILADAFRDLKRTDLADELTICSPRLSDSLRIHRFNKQFSEDCWDELDGITLDSSDEKARRRKSTRYMDDLQAVKFVNAYTDPLYRVIEQSKITLDHKLKSMGGLIKTTAYEKAMKILQSTGLIIITGNAGDGKTSLAINILRKMKKRRVHCIDSV